MLRAQRPVLRRRGTVGVLDPVRGFVGGRATALDVHHEVRLGADVAAQADELVGPEVARFALVPPRQVAPLGPLVARSDAPEPVVVLGDVATGPADEGRTERLDPIEDVGAHLVHGIAGHQRHLIEPDTTPAVERERQPRQRIGRATAAARSDTGATHRAGPDLAGLGRARTPHRPCGPARGPRSHVRRSPCYAARRSRGTRSRRVPARDPGGAARVGRPAPIRRFATSRSRSCFSGADGDGYASVSSHAKRIPSSLRSSGCRSQ